MTDQDDPNRAINEVDRLYSYFVQHTASDPAAAATLALATVLYELIPRRRGSDIPVLNVSVRDPVKVRD